MKTFVVLGSHRSATSLVAEAMNSQIEMHATTARYESQPFIDLNKKILKQAGGSWDNPPSREAILKVDVKEEIQALVKSCERELWGWKDPRTTLTIELYWPYLTNPHIIACFRDPKEVGKSLERRGDMSAEEGEKLAHIYNQRLIDFLYVYRSGR